MRAHLERRRRGRGEWPGTSRCCPAWAASAMPVAAVVLVMSVIAAMWSQSMPWRIPSRRPGEQHAEVDGGRGDGGAGADDVEHGRGPSGWRKSVAETVRYRNGLQLRVVAASSMLSHDDGIRIDPSGIRPRVGRRPRPAARPRAALDAAATHADRGPVAVGRPRDRRRAGRTLPRDRPRRRSPRPSTGRSTSSRSSACSATATAPTAARSSTSCRRRSTATSTASTAGRPGRSRPARRRPSSRRSSAGAASRSTSATCRSPAAAPTARPRSTPEG